MGPPRYALAFLVGLLLGGNLAWTLAPAPSGPSSQVRTLERVQVLEETCHAAIVDAYRIGYDRSQEDAILGAYMPERRAETFRVRVLRDTTNGDAYSRTRLKATASN